MGLLKIFGQASKENPQRLDRDYSIVNHNEKNHRRIPTSSLVIYSQVIIFIL